MKLEDVVSYYEEVMDRTDKLVIDMSISILKTDRTSIVGKEESKRYMRYLMEFGSESQKNYIKEKCPEELYKED